MLSVAVTTGLNDPEAVGEPESDPPLDKVSPDGRPVAVKV